MAPALLACLLASVPPAVQKTQDVPIVQSGPGVSFQELTGRGAHGSSRTVHSSVALFHLAPGRRSQWSHNKIGEESFFVLAGHGTVWIGAAAQPVGPGSFVVVPPDRIRSVQAGAGETLDYYALTTPAWSAEDDVQVAAPAGVAG
jgi:mannose-6-phosphate isomerase-like protein (cupin superfamily)